MEDPSLEKQKEKVRKAALAAGFVDSDFGKLVINEWLNPEIMRLTNKLVNDDDLDRNNAARAAVRGELKAYRLISEKLTLVKTQGEQAQKNLEENNIDASEFDTRTPEEMAEDAGI